MEGQFNIDKIVSSESLGDPTMYATLRWHMRHCDHCTNGMNATKSPPAFGARDNRHCDEYYDIVQEYSDYERDYISKGNP